MIFNKYKLYFIQRMPSGKENEWTEEVVPRVFDAEKNLYAPSLNEYMHLRGYVFMDGGYQVTLTDGTFIRAVDTVGYPEKIEIEG